VDGITALKAATAWRLNLVMLSLMLPRVSGPGACRRLRGEQDARVRLPVVMLTALGGESDRVAGLESGADGYVTRPFSSRKLALRVRAVLRRAGPAGPAATPRPVRSGRLEAGLAARRARSDGRELEPEANQS